MEIPIVNKNIFENQRVLWENDNPQTDFSGSGIINIDEIPQKEEDYIKIEWRTSTNNGEKQSIFIPVGSLLTKYGTFYLGGIRLIDYSSTKVRRVYTEHSYLIIDNCVDFGTAAETTYNNYIIPTKITWVRIKDNS